MPNVASVSGLVTVDCTLGFPKRIYWVCRGRDRMVVGFTTTYVISTYHH